MSQTMGLEGSGPLRFDGRLELPRVISHLVAPGVEATDKRAKGSRLGRAAGIAHPAPHPAPRHRDPRRASMGAADRCSV